MFIEITPDCNSAESAKICEWGQVVFAVSGVMQPIVLKNIIKNSHQIGLNPVILTGNTLFNRGIITLSQNSLIPRDSV